MASVISTKILRHGLEVFALISLIVFGVVLFYGNNLEGFIDATLSLKWGWFLVGIGLASMDWFGGGARLWVLAKHVFDRTPVGGSILASGLNTWASYLTPSQTGGGPMMIYTLKRFGVPLPQAMVSTLMTFVATVLFFAIIGPLAVFRGAGQSLAQHGVLGQTINLNDLFRLSLAGFLTAGLAAIFLIAFPSVARRLVRWIVRRIGRRFSDRVSHGVDELLEGIDRAHESMVAFFRVTGWLALAGGIVLSAAAHANKLLAGYVVLRMLDIHAPFVDVLLLQTLIVFLLYFAPTPGGSGLAEILSAAVMSIYVPRELTPSYILLWRIIVCYLTVGFGSFVFWRWLKAAEDRGGKSLQEQEIPTEPI